MRRWKWFQRPNESIDVVERSAYQPVACDPPTPPRKQGDTTSARPAAKRHSQRDDRPNA